MRSSLGRRTKKEVKLLLSRVLLGLLVWSCMLLLILLAHLTNMPEICRAFLTSPLLVLLPQHFGQAQYIHVIRNELDMAHSGNQGHLTAWGNLFGVETPSSPELLPSASLEYWIEANEATLARDQRLLGDRFLVISFDRLCLEPEEQVERLIRFLDLEPEIVDIARLCALVEKPPSLGRHRKYDVGFEPDALEAVRRLAFSCGSNLKALAIERASVRECPFHWTVGGTDSRMDTIHRMALAMIARASVDEPNLGQSTGEDL